MKYNGFRIRNFRGVEDTTIKFSSTSKSHIYTLVGLNESGKTTLLEAIYSFSPDPENKSVVTPELVSDNKDALVPKHLVSDFTGKITVSAMVELDESDIDDLEVYTKENFDFLIDRNSIIKNFNINRVLTYSASEFEQLQNLWNFQIKGFKKGRKKIVDIEHQSLIKILNYLTTKLPVIAYYPTFVFDFPERIYLSGRNDDKNNNFYRRVFQDILDAQGEGLTIEKHIVDRIRRSDLPTNALEYIARLLGGDSNVKEQIDAVMLKASSMVTKIVFGKWNEIFKEKIGNKEIVIDWKPEIDENGEKNIYIQFIIKDGVNKYTVRDRSLGFRWFFCFLLFTQFRAARKEGRGTLFLFDEPASNLHSRAQEQLLNSFPAIASGKNRLIYSTHSHYMINPHWLEQTFIIENKAIDYQNGDVELQSASERTEICATPYRSFVGQYPDKTTYFQPILDKIDYRPSLLEFKEKNIIVEGKSDFYLLSYFSKYIFGQKHCIFPSSGANDVTPIVSLLLGWGRQFRILLDSDKTGINARKHLCDEFGLPETDVSLLGELTGDKKYTAIESLLEQEDLDHIRNHFKLSMRPNKKHIMRFFAECLSSGEKISFSANLKKRVQDILEKMTS